MASLAKDAKTATFSHRPLAILMPRLVAASRSLRFHSGCGTLGGSNCSISAAGITIEVC